MKICKIYIKNYLQFKDFELDLTHPQTGAPLEKICLIGKNGTGKTNLLELIKKSIFIRVDIHQKQPVFIAFKFLTTNTKSFYTILLKNMPFYFRETIEQEIDWKEILSGENENLKDELKKKHGITSGEYEKELDGQLLSLHRDDSLVIYCPAESRQNAYAQISDVPASNVNEALTLFKDFPVYHEIASETVSNFWTLLIFLMKKRQNEWETFLTKNENQDKTARNLREEFDRLTPKILEKIAEVWNKILDSAGLEFDYESASNPIQLNDNLKAYIILKSTRQPIAYNQLSTGIRNFIFRVGHIYSLYFNRKIEQGFLLIDEPENSLFPDFLYDLIETYQKITAHTQLFVATHSPIIAAQFESYERFILDFEDGFVTAHRGKTPIGDDPNDILIKDFGIRSVLGKKGTEKWERFIALKTLIPLEIDKNKKFTMMQEYMQIGSDYNFPTHEVS